MLRKVTLKNFKAYGPEGTEFELAPITLILGANSLGKSSMFQALMALKQTWDTDLTGISLLKCTGRYVELGSFSNVLHRDSALKKSDEAPQVSVSIAWSASTDVEPHESQASSTAQPIFEIEATDGDAGNDQADATHGRSESGDPEVGLTWCGDIHREGDEIKVRPVENRLVAVTEGTASGLKTRMTAKTESEGHVSLVPDVTEAAAHQRPSAESIDEHVIRIETGGRVLHGAGDNHTAQRRLYNILELRQKLIETVHIGPLRSAGERLYHPGNPGMDFVGYTGQDFVGLLTEDPDSTAERIKMLDEALESLEIPYRLSLRPVVTTTRYAYELLLESRSDKSPEHVVGLPDVGFGISQVLPLLTQYIRDWHVAPNSVGGAGPSSRTILVEQPELHLHPLWQANLARYFCRCLRDARSDATRGTPPQVIMETHSELMVLQVLKMVEAGVVKPDDISLLFIQPDQVYGPQVKRIRVNEKGREMDPWPTGFFPERIKIRSRPE